jgi:hypothetical protein
VLALSAAVQFPVQSVQSPLSQIAVGGGTLAVKFAAHFATHFCPLAMFTQPWIDVLFASSGANTGGDRQGDPAMHELPLHCSHCALQQRE